MSDARADIWAVLKKAEACMLVDNIGEALRARPMQPFADEEGHAIWFITDRGSPKADEIMRRPEVCITTSEPDACRFVSVTGRAEIVDDRDKLEELWTRGDDRWFEGPEDPGAVLLKVTPRHGQIWEGLRTPLAEVELLFSEITGVEPEAMRRAEKSGV